MKSLKKKKTQIFSSSISDCAEHVEQLASKVALNSISLLSSHSLKFGWCQFRFMGIKFLGLT